MGKIKNGSFSQKVGDVLPYPVLVRQLLVRWWKVNATHMQIPMVLSWNISFTIYIPVIITVHTRNYLSSSILVILINPLRAISKQLIIKLLYIHTIHYQLPFKFFLKDCRIKRNTLMLPFQNNISLSPQNTHSGSQCRSMGFVHSLIWLLINICGLRAPESKHPHRPCLLWEVYLRPAHTDLNL